MAKHRLGQSEGAQWGGPDLVKGAEEALSSRSDADQPESTTGNSEDD